jgi:hypothetical protein
MNQTNQTKTTSKTSQVHVVPVLTETELVTMLLNLPKGNNFVTAITRTIPNMNKGSNPFYDVTLKDFTVRKISEVNGSIQYDYESNVNRQLEREGKEPDFEAAAAKWGNRVGSSCVIEHNGRYYFDMRVLKSLGHYYVDLNGNRLNDDDVTPHVKPHSSSGKQGTDKEIIVRRYMMANLVSVTINGNKFVILH